MSWQLRLLDVSYDYAKDYLAKDCFERKLGMNRDLKPQEPITFRRCCSKSNHTRNLLQDRFNFGVATDVSIGAFKLPFLGNRIVDD